MTSCVSIYKWTRLSMATEKITVSSIHAQGRGELLWCNQCLFWSSRDCSQGLGKKARCQHKSRASCQTIYLMLHSLRKEASALLREGVQGKTIHILHIKHNLHNIIYTVYCTYFAYSRDLFIVLLWFCHELQMPMKKTTGMSLITPVTPPSKVCPWRLIIYYR